MLAGNHDQSSKDGSEYSIYAFKSFCTVVGEPGWQLQSGRDKHNLYAVLAIPYSENLEIIKKTVDLPCPTSSAHRLFLGHLGVQGAICGADFVYSNPHDP